MFWHVHDAATPQICFYLSYYSHRHVTQPPRHVLALNYKVFFNVSTRFYILLSVHLVMILGKWPTWRTFLFYVFISILYMFRAASCSSSGESTVSIQHLAYVTLCRWPFRVQVAKDLSDLHTKQSPTQSDICQMLYWYNRFSWWWARGCSKRVENWNKYIEKNCASSWSFTKNRKYEG
jgi:hypothetical protein